MGTGAAAAAAPTGPPMAAPATGRHAQASHSQHSQKGRSRHGAAPCARWRQRRCADGHNCAGVACCCVASTMVVLCLAVTQLPCMRSSTWLEPTCRSSMAPRPAAARQCLPARPLLPQGAMPTTPRSPRSGESHLHQSLGFGREVGTSETRSMAQICSSRTRLPMHTAPTRQHYPRGAPQPPHVQHTVHPAHLPIHPPQPHPQPLQRPHTLPSCSFSFLPTHPPAHPPALLPINHVTPARPPTHPLRKHAEC